MTDNVSTLPVVRIERSGIEEPVAGVGSKSAWQPIETAPKDGTGIIVTDCRVKDWTHVAFWDEEGAYPYVWGRDDSGGHWHKDMFTHWMPLPEPPPA